MTFDYRSAGLESQLGVSRRSMSMKITWTAKTDKQMSARLHREVLLRTARTGNLVLEAVKQNLTGPRSGRWYYKPGGGMYRASAIGEYPAQRTGHLRSRIFTMWSPDQMSVAVGTDVPYGKILENKFPPSGGRPWLKRTADSMKTQISALWQQPWRLK